MFLLNALGFSLKDEDYEEEIFKILNSEATNRYSITSPLCNYLLKDLGDIELWYSYNQEEGINNVLPHFRSSTFIEMDDLGWRYLSFNHEYAFAAGNTDMMPIEFIVPDAGFYDTLKQNKRYKVELSLLTLSATLYHDMDEFLADNKEIPAKAFCPISLYEEEIEGYPKAYITGFVNEVSLKENTYTNEAYYIINIASMGGDYTLIANFKAFSRKPEVGEIIGATVIPEGRIMEVFKGWEDFFSLEVKNPIIPGINNLNDLYEAIIKVIDKDTAYAGRREYWTSTDRMEGESDIIALLAANMFDADIYQIELDDTIHYFNKIKDKYFDLASEEFELYHTDLPYLDADEISSNLLKGEGITKRYNELVERIKLILAPNSNSEIN